MNPTFNNKFQPKKKKQSQIAKPLDHDSKRKHASDSSAGVPLFCQRSVASSVRPDLIQRQLAEEEKEEQLEEESSIQTKLTIGKRNDKYEIEADRVSDQVMRMQDNEALRSQEDDELSQTKSVADQITPIVQREIDSEGMEEDEETLQTKQTDNQPAKPSPELSARIQSLKKGGQPLPESERSFFEPRFGHDFSQARVHTDSKAAETAESINAKAFTSGKDIIFGSGQYAPNTKSGKSLLAHELTHVVQQTSLDALQQVHRKPKAGKKDSEIVLGEKLWKDFPDGVFIAFYDKDEPVAVKTARAWAKTVNSVAPGKGKISANKIKFGEPIPDNRNMVKTLIGIGNVLKSAVSKTAPSEIEMLGGEPGSILRLKKLSPAKINTLAIFAHGSSGACYIGKGLNRRNAEYVIKELAPYLSSDVKILIFACSTASGPEEYDTERDEWVKGTMKMGGKGSLAFKVRDALIKHGKKDAQVWGHPSVGHVSRNPALRVFYSDRGAGSLGESYVASYIFTPTIIRQISNALKSEIISEGYSIPNESKYKTKAEALVTLEVYNCWIQAAKNKKFNNRPLSEMAPTFPHEVADIVLKYWNQTWWPRRKHKLTKRLIKRLKLPKS